MIAAMLNIAELQRSILIVIIEPENLARMRKADPITLESVNNHGLLEPPLYPDNFNLLIAYEEDELELYSKLQGNPAELLRWLERNRKFHPAVDGKQNSFKLNRREEKPL